MTTDISKIRVSLNNCEEVTLPYKFPHKCWIKYITVKGEDEAYYEGGQYTGMGNHKIFLVNKGKSLYAPTCVRADNGEVIYKSRFFIDPNKTAECEQQTSELDKIILSQQNVIKKMSQQLKLLEDKTHEIQVENYDIRGELEDKNKEISHLMTQEKKYKLILSQYIR